MSAAAGGKSGQGDGGGGKSTAAVSVGGGCSSSGGDGGGGGAPSSLGTTMANLGPSDSYLGSHSPLSSSMYNIDESDFPVRRRKKKKEIKDIKSWCMPFFKKFWANVGHGSVKQSLRSDLYGRPVEEVDPFVFEETFCVIARKYGKHYVYRFSATRSLFIFGPLNPIRKIACRIISNQLFDLFIILIILCNCVTLALSTNYEVGTTGEMYRNLKLEYVVNTMEYVYLGIYTVEMILKVIAKGFVVNKFSYLRNSWNFLDFLVVSSGYLTIALSIIFDDQHDNPSIDLDFLRTFRVLRAIKTISILPGLRMMIDALLSSVVQLLEVMALTLFCLMIFALLALELYMGKLRQKCVLTKGSEVHRRMIEDGERDPSEIDEISPMDPDANRLWNDWVNQQRNWYMRPDEYPKDEFMPCANSSWARLCPDGYQCLEDIGDNFDDGWTSFDTFHSSMLSTFQLITLDFWERLYDLVLSTTTPWSVIFFLIVIFLGSFYLLNLMLAVVAMSYEEEVQQSTQSVPLTKHQKLSIHRSASTFSFDDPRKLNVTPMVQYKKRTPSEREMIARTLRNSSLAKRKPRRAIRRKQNQLTIGGAFRRGTGGSGGTPNMKSATASICDDSYGGGGGGFDSVGGSSVSGIADDYEGFVSDDVLRLRKSSAIDCVVVRPGTKNSSNYNYNNNCSTSLVGSSAGTTTNNTQGESNSVTSTVDIPKVRIAKIMGKKESGGTIKVDSCIINPIEPSCVEIGAATSHNFYLKKNNNSSSCENHGGGGCEESSLDFEEEEEDELGESKKPNLHTAIMTLLGRKFSLDIPTVVANRDRNLVVTTGEQENNGISAGKSGSENDVFPINPPCSPSSPTCLPTSSHLSLVPIESGISPHNSHHLLHHHQLQADISSSHPIIVSSSSPPEPKNFTITASCLKTRNEDAFRTCSDIVESLPRRSYLSRKSIALPTTRAAFFFRRVKLALSPVVNHWTFELAITAIIIVNTVLLASEHHNQPQWLDEFLKIGNHFFTGIFLLEALIKICALQKDYFLNRWNQFDFFIVIISLVDTFQESLELKLNVMRSMRLLRVFKLAQSWITMKVLLNIIFSTFGALGNLVLVLLIVLYIFAVLGLQVLGSYYTRKSFDAIDDEDEFPRWNWQDFWYAFMMVFRVLCGEWIEPLWDCLKATSESNQQYRCFFIYLPILVVGNFIVLNLFLALLLNSFDTEELNAQREKELEASGKSDNLKKIVGLLLTKKHSAKGSTKGNNTSSMDTASFESSDHPTEDMSTTAETTRTGASPGRARFRNVARKVIILNRKAVAERMIEIASMKARQSRGSSLRVPSSKNDSLMSRKSSTFGLGSTNSTSHVEIAEQRKMPDPCFPLKCWTVNCFCCNALRSSSWKRWDRARALAMTVVTHPFFEWFILALIFASSITLCFEDVHLEERQLLKTTLRYLNGIFTGIFVAEMLLKWFALGIWSYFTNSWTILDFIIVTISLITLQSEVMGEGGYSKSQLGSLKALRTLRALRPLRAISRWQGMKIVVNALMFAIPSIFNVLLVCLLFWLIFSIMGVQFFKGKFYKCVDNESGEMLSHEIVKTKAECCANTDKWSWVNTQPNFDNVFQGYLTLFQVATFEGWMEAMQAAVDSTEVDMQPIRDNSFVYYGFFLIFIVFGSFFTLNLFIGVIIDNFNRLKKKYEGNLLEVLLTPSQRHYYTAMKKLGRKKPRKVIKRPSNSFLSLFYDISMSRRFEIAIFFLIFMNMVIMAFEHHNQRQIYMHILSGFNSFFTTIYALEAIVKIIGLRQYYFTVPWNLFDFILVVASIFDLAVGDLATLNFPIPPTMLRIVRVFRIGRVLRLIKAAKGIRKLLFALIVSLPALFNIGALLALITFIYAILGMTLFGRVAKNTAIDAMFNFDTFLQSCLMLLRIMTAAGWNDVLVAMTEEVPECGSYRKIKCGLGKEGECANTASAVAFLVSYLIITYLIVINMYIAIILENFVEANREEEVGIVEDDLEMFYVRWSRYDPQATQFISFDQLSEFLASLDPPLGIPKPNIVAIVAFNLPIARGNKIHCLDILHALVKHVLGHIDDSEEFRKLQEQMEHKFRKQFPTRKLLDIISSTRVWKIQHNAAVVIQRAWRAYRARLYPPADKVKATQTVHHGSITSNQKEHQGMLNKMGNLLHLGHYHHGGEGGKGRRRLSVNEAKPSISPGEERSGGRLSDVSDVSQLSVSPIARVGASGGTSRRRTLSPSRMSGGSFDVAITYGNQLCVQKNKNVPTSSHTPLASCPSTPSSTNGESQDVIVQIHHPL